MYVVDMHFEVSGNLWRNFEEFAGDQPDPDDYDTNDNYSRDLYLWMDAALAEVNAIDIRNTTLIQFETEEDAAIFKLKFL